MKLALLSTLAVALLLGQAQAQAQACAEVGDVCQVKGNTTCGCDIGHLVSINPIRFCSMLICLQFKCEEKDNGGLVWKVLKNCLYNPNGLECVNGRCIMKK